MANRHLLRSIVLQSLFEWDFRKSGYAEPGTILQRNIDEFASDVGDSSFAGNLLGGIVENQAALDEVIEKAAPDWPIDRISVVDRNILRLGLFELLFSDRSDVPPKVAINEAIELAKTFGGDTSGRFVNGVLGAVYKEIGEPGKDERTGGRDDVPYEELPVETLVGAVIYAEHDDDVYLALVHDIFGHWTLSKGHISEGEDLKEGVAEVAKRELGLDVSAEEVLGENEYVANDPEKKRIRKHVTYFLARADFVDLALMEGGGLDDANWFKMKDILDLNFYDDILPVITKAVNVLLKKTGTSTSH